VFRLAQSEVNFTLFGNDVIQCFYDVATVSGEPVALGLNLAELRVSLSLSPPLSLSVSLSLSV